MTEMTVATAAVSAVLIVLGLVFFLIPVGTYLAVNAYYTARLKYKQSVWNWRLNTAKSMYPNDKNHPI